MSVNFNFTRQIYNNDSSSKPVQSEDQNNAESIKKNLREGIKKLNPNALSDLIQDFIKKNENMVTCFLVLQSHKPGYKKDELLVKIVSLLAKKNEIKEALAILEESFVQFSGSNHDDIKDRVSTLIECAKYDPASVSEKVQEIEPKNEMKKVRENIVRALMKAHLDKATQFLLFVSPEEDQKDLMKFMAYELSKSFSSPEKTLARALAKKEHLSEIVCLIEVIQEEYREDVMSYIAYDLSGSMSSPEETIASKLAKKGHLIDIVYFIKYVPKTKLDEVMRSITYDLSAIARELTKKGHLKQLVEFMQYVPKTKLDAVLGDIADELSGSSSSPEETIVKELTKKGLYAEFYNFIPYIPQTKLKEILESLKISEDSNSIENFIVLSLMNQDVAEAAKFLSSLPSSQQESILESLKNMDLNKSNND